MSQPAVSAPKDQLVHLLRLFDALPTYVEQVNTGKVAPSTVISVGLPSLRYRYLTYGQHETC